jgi:hypothetical protein
MKGLQMSILSKVIDEFDLCDTQNGKIEVAIIEEPYGENSPSVVSIGIFLDKENKHPDWKVHVPKDNINSLIDALQKAKEAL